MVSYKWILEIITILFLTIMKTTTKNQTKVWELHEHSSSGLKIITFEVENVTEHERKKDSSRIKIGYIAILLYYCAFIALQLSYVMFLLYLVTVIISMKKVMVAWCIIVHVF